MRVSKDEDALEQGTPGEMFDTVAVELPAAPGTSLALFRDFQGKGDAFTNFVKSRQLRPGEKLLVKKISVESFLWSGDNLVTQLGAIGRVEVLVNRKLIFAGSAIFGGRDLTDPLSKGGFVITDTDDISGDVKLSAYPWGRPYEHKVEEFREEFTQRMELPSWLSRVRLFVPHFPSSLSNLRFVKRPLEGVVLVRVHLAGLISGSGL